jgi:hypothetical protein
MSDYNNMVEILRLTKQDQIDILLAFIRRQPSIEFESAIAHFIAGGPKKFEDTPVSAAWVPDDAQINLKNAIFDELARQGCPEVRVTYSGSGDEGYLEQPDYSKHIDDSVKITFDRDGAPDTMTLDAAVKHLAKIILEDLHGGWENNEGGHGSFTYHTALRAIAFEHIDIIEEEAVSFYKL